MTDLAIGALLEVDVTGPGPLTLDVAGGAINELSLAAGIPGPPGPQGPAGPTGPAAPVYVFRQATPAATWTIVHMLGRKPPVVVVLDTAPTVAVFTDVVYPDLDTIVLEFPTAESGYAHL